MTTYDAGQFTLEQVREHVWEMPREGDMRVPARVLASEALLDEISEDKTLQQLRNTTHLPGIHKRAICMPDGHQGYGFPVGGVAALDAEDGCISPGAVGYDINCLPYDTDVLLEFGRSRRIGELGETFEHERAMVVGDETSPSDIRLVTESGQTPIFELETTAGDTVRASADHQFMTTAGMQKLETLEPGDRVCIHPFQGLPDEAPESFTVLSERDFAGCDPDLVASLTDRDILPLKSTDAAFNRLLKLVGYHLGAGGINEMETWFSGTSEGLDQLREDIATIGFTPSKILRDGRSVASITVAARAFRELLVRLGVPADGTAESAKGHPAYLDRLAGWQRALYLSGLFGAAMSAPAAASESTFAAPGLTQTRLGTGVKADEQFMEELAQHLNTLGIETDPVEHGEATSARDDEQQFNLGVANDAENLIQFFTTIGYRYCPTKQRKAIAAAQYLKRQSRIGEKRPSNTGDATALADGGTRDGELGGSSARATHVERPDHQTAAPDFEAFWDAVEVRDNRTVEATILSIERAGSEPVFDIGVAHDAHTFLADGFVVSNCGVRMVRTNLDYADLQGHEEELVNTLFANIPSGLGGGGVYEGSTADVEDILDRGMEWALEHDFAVRDDLDHCEDEGFRPEADPGVISSKAKDRGRTQIGSLGSGNHFLEVQRVTDVFREDVAADFGLRTDQVVVLIHTGSRGLGHQVCTDYLRDIEQTHAGLLAQLPDKELAAAPAGSRLADEYYRAMCAAINFAWVNRQLITHRTRRVFEQVFDRDWESMDMSLLYDVAHNIAKREVHDVGLDGTTDEREVFVHRKGATRAFPAGHQDVPAAYRDVGQPIIIPGSMGSGSYVLRGGEHSLAETFGSTAHGAGRLMSRTQAKQEYWGEDVMDELRDQNRIYVKAQSGATVAEEAPGVYKDVDEVVRVSDALGIGDKVARTFPVCNIKG